MPKIIKDGAVIDDSWQILPADATEVPDGPVIIPLALWQAKKSALLSGRNELGIWLNSDESPELIKDDLNQFQLVAINFPVFADGRGFSYARGLRERYNYAGEIRAIGGFMRDQLFYLRRCGFNAFALQSNEIEEALQSLNDFSDSYQSAIDQPQPLFRRR